MSEVGFRRLDHPHVLERLRDYAVRELAPRPEVREVVLIGSLARGNWSARSDADLVVVVDGGSELPRGSDYAPTGPFPIPVDVLVFTAAGARRWSRRFRIEVERGIGLYRR